MKLYYDLHTHSCLSPCADDDMTPSHIVGMGYLNGLGLMALTDHNSCANCAPFLAACERYRMAGLPGMELTTAEEIHLLCLFSCLQDALVFDDTLSSHRMQLKNKPEIFGKQLICDDDGHILREEENLLIYATDLMLEDALDLVHAHNGIAYPAHIDREANGIEAILGTIPPQIPFPAMELHDGEKEAAYREKYPHTAALPYLVCSDAHTLGELREINKHVEIPDDTPYENVARLFFEKIKKGWIV